MTIKEKIEKAIINYKEYASPLALEEYEDDYDGFTHSTYELLAEAVFDELENDGHVKNVSQSLVNDYVENLF